MCTRKSSGKIKKVNRLVRWFQFQVDMMLAAKNKALSMQVQTDANGKLI